MPESNKSTQKFVTGEGQNKCRFKKSTYHRAIPGQNLLGLDNNWKVSADLPGWCNDYPKIISNKGLRPDIVLFSKENSKVILVELTISFESRQEQSHDYKTSKYDLKKELKKEGYIIIVKVVEIGARGFVASTLYQFLGQIGINRRNRNKSMKRLTEIIENCSMWIWNKRNVPWNISKETRHSITCWRIRNNILITRADLKINISPLDVDLIGCYNGASC